MIKKFAPMAHYVSCWTCVTELIVFCVETSRPVSFCRFLSVWSWLLSSHYALTKSFFFWI